MASPAAEEFEPAPRPYAWKTDEYRTQTESRKTSGGYVGPPAFPPEVQGYELQRQHARLPQFAPGNYRCPNCMSQLLPMIERRISTGGWVTFALLLVFFFPLFWIGLLIKEDVQTCPSCRRRVS